MLTEELARPKIWFLSEEGPVLDRGVVPEAEEPQTWVVLICRVDVRPDGTSARGRRDRQPDIGLREAARGIPGIGREGEEFALEDEDVLGKPRLFERADPCLS